MSSIPADTVISGSQIITMDAERRVFTNGAIAIAGNLIAAVGPCAEIDAKYDAATKIDGRNFVITPGLINGHIHVTGDPLTRAWLPDDIDCDFAEELERWVLPRFLAHGPEDECVSAELAALKMLKSGTTCFLEAGTVQYLDKVVEGADRAGIRGRVGAWVEGRGFDSPNDQAKLSKDAIRLLEDEIARFPAGDDARIAAWPILVGHSTNTDEVWQAAKSIADGHGLGVAAHMSPYQSDPDWFLDNFGHRPIEHLAEIGVLGDNVCLTHLAYIDESEQNILADTHTNAVLCPLAALKGAFGITSVGRFPEMAAAGINLMLGSDGFDSDMLRQAQLVSGLYKDVRQDVTVFPAEEILAMLTLNGAAGLGMSDEIGSLEAGKKADFVCHDTTRPEWQPMLNALNQLMWLADGRSVHSVWVDGVRVIDNYRSTMIDERELYARAKASSEAVIGRSELPSLQQWPLI